MNQNRAENSNPVKVIDSLMGTGKTSFAIQYINEHPEKRFIYCTPFLNEVARIQKACSALQFAQPEHRGGTKLDNFNVLLEQGRNIAVTHCTFSNATDETLQYLQSGNYTLILDEVIDVLEEFNKACSDNIREGDIHLLRDQGFISVDGYGRVTWTGREYSDNKYSNVERTAKAGNLYLLQGKLLIWQFPQQVFGLFEDVFILTYMFAGSYLKPYFEYHSIPYELKSINKDTNGRYSLTAHRNDIALRAKYKALIDVFNGKGSQVEMNAYINGELSATWFKRGNKKQLILLKKQTYNYFRNIMKAKAIDILWTTYERNRSAIKGKGYTQHNDANGNTVECFLACNARATNEYREKSILAYIVNLYPDPMIQHYFINKNRQDGTSIGIDADTFALVNMLQWIWRSRIREGKPIHIWIPSKRMRNLLQEWFDGKR